MNKIILWLSFLGLAFSFIAGIITPDSSTMWMLSTSMIYTYLRAGLLVIVLALLVTEPPRNLLLRMMAGSASLLLVSWSLSSTYQNHMQLGDAFLFLSVGLATGISVLERELLIAQPVPVLNTSARRHERTRN